MKCNPIVVSVIFSLFLTSCEIQPEFGEKEIAHIVNLYMDGKDVEAKNYIRSSLDKKFTEVDKAKVLEMLAGAYDDLGMRDSAQYFFEQALSIDSNRINSWIGLGAIHRANGHYRDAESCYLQALVIDPSNADLQTSIGVLYLYTEREESALSHLRRAIELDPRYPTAHANLAIALAQVGEYEESEQEFETAISLGYNRSEELREMLDAITESNGDKSSFDDSRD